MDIAKLFAYIKWLNSRIRFAADTEVQVEQVLLAIDKIDKARAKLGRSKGWYTIYTMLHGSIAECINRISAFRSNKRIAVVAQPYRNFNDPLQTIPQWQKDMARWANKHMIFRSCEFKDFSPRAGFKCSQYFK